MMRELLLDVTGATAPIYAPPLADVAAEADVWRRYFARTRTLLLLPEFADMFPATQPLRQL